MDIKLDRKRSEEEVGSFYGENPYPKYEAVPKRIKSFLYPYLNEINKKEQPTYLDAGCGTGHAVAQVAMDYPKFKCHGIDLSVESIKISKKLASKHNVNVNFHCGSYSEKLPFNTKFDFIYCSGTIHHNAEPIVAVRNLLNYLKDDGYIFIHLYGEKADSERMRKKSILNIMEPALDNYDQRFKLFRELVDHEARGIFYKLRTTTLTDIWRWLKHNRRTIYRKINGIPEQDTKLKELSTEFKDAYCHPLEKTYNVSDVKQLADESGLDVMEMFGLGKEILKLLPPEWKQKYSGLDKWSRWHLFELLLIKSPSVLLLGRKKLNS